MVPVTGGGRSVAIVAALLAGCSTTHPAPEAPKPADTYGQQATLRAIGGSAVFGKIRVIDRGSNATVLVSAMNLPMGAYRIAFGETPNCTSPNGFSAGAAWAPPGSDPKELMPVQYATQEGGHIEAELRVAGLQAEGARGVAGHSVVLYTGSKVTDARPDVPNERLACGVFEPAKPPNFF